jgi:hypothetical protein
LGARLTTPLGDVIAEPALQATLGAGVSTGDWRWELAPGFSLGWIPTRRQGPRSLRLRDRALSLSASGLQRVGTLWAGAWLAAGAHFMSAEAAAGSERDGSRDRLWSVAGGGELQLPLVPGWSARLAAGLEGMKHRQRYAVAGDELADLGRLRGVLSASILGVWPRALRSRGSGTGTE